MIDNDNFSPPRDNLRSLIYMLSVELDERISRRRSGTKYSHVRASDVRVFIFASNGKSTLSDVARALGISRQAVHMSAKRLRETGVVELKPSATRKRELVISLTPDGEAAMLDSHDHIRMLEDEVMEVIGASGLENLRRTLQAVLLHARAKNLAASEGLTPQA